MQTPIFWRNMLPPTSGMKHHELVQLYRLITRRSLRPMGGGEKIEPGPSEEKW
jgi:hypothetical protein